MEVFVQGAKVFETSKSAFIFGEMALLYDGSSCSPVLAAETSVM